MAAQTQPGACGPLFSEALLELPGVPAASCSSKLLQRQSMFPNTIHTCRAVVPQPPSSTVSTCLAPVSSDSSGRAARLIWEMEGKADMGIH